MREFRMAGSRGQTKTWLIGVEGSEIVTVWGILGGRTQSTIDRIKAVNVGRANELGPEANALEEAKRRIKKKVDEGYVEYIDGVAADYEEPGVDWVRGLPKQFCGYKPRPQPQTESKEAAELADTLEGGHAIITVKEDGFKHWVMVTDPGLVRIWTSRMEECTDKYPHLVTWFSTKHSGIPPRSLMCCEFTVRLKDGRCDRLTMQAISNSLPPRARSIQQDPDKKVTATVLSIPFWGGVDVITEFTWGQIIEFLEEQFGLPQVPFIRSMEIFYGPFDEAVTYVKDNGYEGLVIYDTRSSPGSKAFNFRGKPERPRCWKWKPMGEDDFIVVFDPEDDFYPKNGSQWGRGKHLDAAGRIALYQLNSDGKLVYCSGCGSGFTTKDRQQIPGRAVNGLCGVAEIKFTSRRYKRSGDGSNALVEPVFIRWRTDKTAEECVNPLL